MVQLDHQRPQPQFSIVSKISIVSIGVAYEKSLFILELPMKRIVLSVQLGIFLSKLDTIVIKLTF